MKKIIVSKFEYEFLIASLEEFYNIRNDKQTPTKKEMIKWIISKLKAKSLDL